MKEFMIEQSASPYFGLFLCIVSYKIGLIIQGKIKIVLFNPLIISLFLCIVFLLVTGIPYKNFKIGASIIHTFLPFTTIMLAIIMFEQLTLIKKNVFPVLVGVFVGCAVSLFSVYALCKLFDLDSALRISMLPKSLTTAIAIPIAEQKGGIPSITAAAVVFTGLLGNMGSPLLSKIFHIKNPLALGLSIGTSSHILGTSKAIEMGEVQGAFSTIALCLNGIVTSIFLAFYL
ncbi:MAG: LrgB family protein [Treponemataceae bacterium]